MIVNVGRPEDATEAESSAAGKAMSNKPWVYLSAFEITCQGRPKARCPVYANNRQQIPVEIYIEGRDENGVLVEVDTSYSVLDLRLCEYDDAESFPYRVGEAYKEDVQYEYNWQVQAAEDDAADQDTAQSVARDGRPGQVVRRWLYTDIVQTRKLAVRCKSPAGVTFVTNTPNPPTGKFDSYVIVDGRAPNAIHWENIAFSDGINAYNDKNFDVDVYCIYFKDPNLRVVTNFFTHDFYPDQAHYRQKHNYYLYLQVCFLMNGPRTVEWKSAYPHDSVKCQFRVNERPHQATAARITDVAGYLMPEGRKYGMALGLIDQYGNESMIGIKPISNGNQMEPADPNSMELGLPEGPEPR